MHAERYGRPYPMDEAGPADARAGSLDPTEVAADAIAAEPAHSHAERQREAFTLDGVKPGQYVEIVDVDDEIARLQAIRLGITQGAVVRCVAKIPAGPIVLKYGMQEIAIGRRLACRIECAPEERGRNGSL